MLFFKKKKHKTEQAKRIILEHLTEEGELPFGWVTKHKDFTEKIEREYSYFLDCWISLRGSYTVEEYGALKTLVIYLDDVKKLCEAKGECFLFWYNHILTSSGYAEKRIEELKELECKLTNK